MFELWNKFFQVLVFSLVNRIIIISTLFLAFSLWTCQTPPNFSDTPKIKFLELKELDANTLGLVIEFEDGNADLGLTSQQINPPYNEYDYILPNGDTVGFPDPNAVDSVKNLTFSNAILSTWVMRNGVFQEAYYGINLQTLDTIIRPDLRFPPVSQKVENAPVSGTIEIRINTQFFPWRDTDTLRFGVYVFDRALNRSNSVFTSAFNVPL